MKIIEQHKQIQLQYTQKIKHTTNTNKITIPTEIIQYHNIQDTIHTYKNKHGQTCLTTKKPKTKHTTLHVYKDHTINITNNIIPGIQTLDYIVLTLDLSKSDDYRNGLGLLTLTTT